MASYSVTPTDSAVDFSRWLGIAPPTIAQPVADTPECSATRYTQTFANGYRLEFQASFRTTRLLSACLARPAQPTA